MGLSMGSIVTWNVRGLNRSLKQKEVRQVIVETKVQVCALLETHLDASIVSNVGKNVCQAWNWVSNASCCNRGTRFMIGWDANMVDVMVLHQTDQVVHSQITFKLDRKSFFCSFVYAENHYNTRRELWNDLCKHNLFVGDKPWVMLGDFNSILFLDDSLSGTSTSNIGTREFKECVNNIEMVDVKSSGLHYTWTNKQKKGKAIFRKIDRVMGNSSFIDVFPDAAACFLPYRISDHTPYTLVLPNIKRDKAKPFKFVNLLAEKKEFLGEVKRIWETEVNGHAMFQVVKKLKCLKSPMRKLMYKQGNLHEKVKVAQKMLDECQQLLDSNPDNKELMNNQDRLLQGYKDAVRDEALFRRSIGLSWETQIQNTFTTWSKQRIIEVRYFRLRM
ncbi:uncharacterized protein LOC110944943 [Helianthus annuus]|uniref:uncharacterized protein LOC110944943 n=1 Tax=Helianthus annuus TaxID=4232 RepID=UPI000B8F11C9|nr:uncharacterized protein LOC110944943 [Helianthus annuus]